MELPPPIDLRCCGSTMEWWSIESGLSIWPSAAQVEDGICVVSCRIIVLNETIYQRVASISTTSTTFRKILANDTRNSQISMLDQGIKISRLFIQDVHQFWWGLFVVIGESTSSKVFLRVEFFLFVFGLVAALVALHGLAFHPLFIREWFDILLR